MIRVGPASQTRQAFGDRNPCTGGWAGLDSDGSRWTADGGCTDPTSSLLAPRVDGERLVLVYDVLASILNLEACFSNSAASLIPRLPRFLLKIRPVRILDTTVCSGTLLWPFSPAWDAVELTLQAGFIRPFVVIDLTDLGATTELLLQALCLSIFDTGYLPFCRW